MTNPLAGYDDDSSSMEGVSSSDEEVGDNYKFRVNQVPKAFSKTEHPFGAHYYDHQGFRECEDIGFARKLVSRYTLEDCQKFRNQGFKDLEADSIHIYTRKRPEPCEVPMVSIIDSEKPHAYYVVVKDFGKKDYLLEAVHREVPADDRPDLFRILKTRFSYNTEDVESNLMMVGDLIVVYSLRRRTKKQTRDVDLTFETIKKNHNKIFWEVVEYSVISRLTAENVAIVELDRSKRTQSTNEKKRYFVAFNELQLIVGDTSRFENVQFENVPGTQDKFYSAKIFFPRVNPGQTITSLSKGQAEYEVLYDTIWHNNGTSFLPTVIYAKKLSDPVTNILKFEPEEFHDGRDEKNWISKCVTLCHFGLSAKYALRNKDRDTNIYTTKIIKADMGQRGPEIEFDIFQSCLREGAQITVNFSEHQKVLMIVVFVDPVGRLNRVRAVMAQHNSTLPPFFDSLRGRCIIVSQEMIDFKQELDAFSRYTRVIHLGLSWNMKVFLLAITGRKIETQPERRWSSVLSVQEIYTKAVDRLSLVFLDGDVCTGKTYACAHTAIWWAQTTNFPEMHVLTAKHEKHTIQLVSQFLRRMKQVGERTKMPKAVRLNNKNGNFETTIDFDRLWPDVLKPYVLDIDEKWRRVSYPEEEVDSNLTTCAVHYLVESGWLNPNDLRSKEIYGRLFYENYSPSYSLAKCFMEIYKPDIIIGTISTLVKAFADDWYAMRERVAYVQIDEAQLIFVSHCFSLAFTFPRARFSMVGNNKATRVRRMKEMPFALAKYCQAIPFRHAILMNPVITLKLKREHQRRPLGGVRSSGFSEAMTGKRAIPEFDDPYATWTDSFSDQTDTSDVEEAEEQHAEERAPSREHGQSTQPR